MQFVEFVQEKDMKIKTLSDGRVYYSPKDLAGILSVSESTIKRWADSGKIRCFRTVGNHRRFSLRAISDFAARYHMEVSLPQELIREADRK
jgi:excisionase family DNA binding protein